MRVKALGNIHVPDSEGCQFLNFSEGAEYVVCTVFDEWFRLVDDSGEPVLARKERFSVVDSALPSWFLNCDERVGPGTFLVPGFFEGWHEGDVRFRRLFELEWARLLSFERDGRGDGV